MAHPLQHQVTVQLSTHITSPKGQKSLTGMADRTLPLPDPGAEESLSLSLSLSQLAFGAAAMEDELLAVCV